MPQATPDPADHAQAQPAPAPAAAGQPRDHAPGEGTPEAQTPIHAIRERFQHFVKAKNPWRGERFDRFTERARRMLVYAQEEAGRLQHNYIGTEHLLLGLLREHEGVGGRVLAGLGVNLDQVRSGVEFIVGRGDKPVGREVSFTPRAKKVIELAVEEARSLKHNYVGTEHVLLGLLREGEGVAAGILISWGLSLERVRQAVLQEVGPETGDPVPTSSSTRDNVISCRVDAHDLEAIDALVEAGIRSTRSDAASWLIHAGIEANLDLFDRVYTTVSEIRRLRESAKQMAQALERKDKPAPAAPEGER